VVHRDIQPENIVITPDELVKLTDFGLAGAEGSLRLTRSGTCTGSPYYMSAEQARGDTPVDARADVYSAGVVLCLKSSRGEGVTDFKVMMER
jgi:serine/threonine-protein kinase